MFQGVHGQWLAEFRACSARPRLDQPLSLNISKLSLALSFRSLQGFLGVRLRHPVRWRRNSGGLGCTSCLPPDGTVSPGSALGQFDFKNPRDHTSLLRVAQPTFAYMRLWHLTMSPRGTVWGLVQMSLCVFWDWESKFRSCVLGRVQSAVRVADILSWGSLG